MSRFDEWEPQLKKRLGSPRRLLGIEIYHDFPWGTVVKHGMNQFEHGQCLAELAYDHCGDKVPALILTKKENELEGSFETDTHHFIVVNLPLYLRESTPNAAISYLARRAEVYEARMARLEELAARPDLILEVLTAEQVADWLSVDPARSGEVREKMDAEGDVPDIDPARVVAVLSRYWQALADDPELRDALFAYDEVGASNAFARWAAERPAEAADALQEVGEGELAALDAAAGVARLRRFLDEWESNRENTDEEDWQTILTRESWVLGQLFGAPFVIVQEKAYVGGKQFDNMEGRITDFLGKNRLTGNALLVEIKTPMKPLLGSPYRQVFAPSAELAGAITQTLDQRQRLIANYQQLGLEEIGAVPFNPRAVVLIGDLERQEVTGEKLRSVELFRNELSGVEVVTFDELAAKAEALLELFRADGPVEPAP
jgi:hypothetical protein